MDLKTLELYTYEGNLNYAQMRGFVLLDQTDYASNEDEDNFWIDLYEDILSEYNMLLEFQTGINNLKQRRKWIFSKKPKSNADTREQAIRKYISMSKLNIQWDEEESIRVIDNMTYKIERLFIYFRENSRRAIEINYCCGEPEIWFSAFSKKYDTLDLVKTSTISPAIIIIDKDLFFIKVDEYPIQQLIHRITAIAKKHNKILEVNI